MFEELKSAIKDAKKIAIFTHEHPDGDALGSSFALALALVSEGKSARVFLDGKGEKTKEYHLICGKEKMSDIKASECDFKIALDCADFSRIALDGESFDGKTAAIDHHITHKSYAAHTVVVDASATGEIIFDLLNEWKIEISPEIANNLYIAIACDTGNFKYSSTTPKTHRAAARLMECGADFAKISRELFYKKSPEYLALYKTALERLEFFCGGKACLMYLSDEDFSAAGLCDETAGDIVTLPTRIEGVEAGAYIRTRDEGFKVSLRSNEYVDVAAIAKAFGGGGHIRAAGFSSELPLEELLVAIREKIESALG